MSVKKASKDTLGAIEGFKGGDFEIVRYREERGRFDGLRKFLEVPGLSGQVDDYTGGGLAV